MICYILDSHWILQDSLWWISFCKAILIPSPSTCGPVSKVADFESALERHAGSSPASGHRDGGVEEEIY